MLEQPPAPPGANAIFHQIDHIAIAVRDLEQAIVFFTEILGFTLLQRRAVSARRTGMLSAEMAHNGIKFVLCQGTEPDSQVSRLIAESGPGVAHIAFSVDDVDATEATLRTRGATFATTIIRSPGLDQVFSQRDMNSGLSFEFIQRKEHDGFSEENINELFAQMESSNQY